MKILHLTLKRKYFDLIVSGKKTEEYRIVKEYWRKRLTNDYGYLTFKEIHFRNGYSPDSPFMRVEYIETTFKVIDKIPTYIIHLGKILEIKNYEPP